MLMLRIIKNYAEFKMPLVSNNIGTVTIVVDFVL